MFKVMATDCIIKPPGLTVEIARKRHVFFLCCHKLPGSWTEAHSSFRCTAVCSSQKWFASLITNICFITLIINRYNDRYLPLLSQLLLIPSRNHKPMGFWSNCPLTFFKQLCWNVINTCWFVPFYLLSKHLKFKDTELRLQRRKQPSGILVCPCWNELQPCRGGTTS